MGSFSSKMRPSTSEKNNSASMSKSEARPSGNAASEITTPRTDATSEDREAKVDSTSQEKLPEAKVVQSFGRLVETAIVMNATAQELMDKVKSKSRNVMTCSDGKYLKSAKLTSTQSFYVKPKQHLHAGCSSSSSSHGEYGNNGGSGCEVNKGDKGTKQMKSGQKNNEDVVVNSRPERAYPVGFGVIGDSAPIGGKAWQKESEDCARPRASKVRGKSPLLLKGDKAVKK